MRTIEPQTLCFGEFSVRPRAHALHKNGIRIKLYGQSFEILLLLLEQPGDVVTREELKKKLWPADTFVDFEHGLNVAIGNLRRALNDSPEEPRFIETVPRIGYRLIADVHTTSDDASSLGGPAARIIATAAVPSVIDIAPIQGSATLHEPPSPSEFSMPVGPSPQNAIAPTSSTATATQLPREKTKPAVLQWAIGIAIFTALLTAVILVRPAAPVPHITGIRQITHLGTVVRNQNLLVAGSRIYFASRDKGGFHIEYVSLGDDSVSSIENLSPKTELQDISPSGNELLISEIELGFSRQWMRSLSRLPIARGIPQRLGNILADSAAWSPDGRTIVYANEVEQSLSLVNVDGTNPRKIATLPGRPSKPRWSPDGKLIRTLLLDQNGGISLWQVEVSGKNPVRMLPGWDDSSQLGSGKWTVDGRYFLFTASKRNSRNIWTLREKADILRRNDTRPSPLTDGSIDFSLPTPSRDGKTIYAVGMQPRGQLMRYDARSHQFEPYMNGLSGDQLSFSRDGLSVAYVAYPEAVLMISRLDGSQRSQLTFAPMRAYSPRWSPDGSQIAFAASDAPGKPIKIHVVSPRGGSARLLVPEIGGEQTVPDWLNDGRSILFGSWSESGKTVSLHVVDVKTGRDTLLRGSAGLVGGSVSPDGRSIAAISADPNESLVLYDIASHTKRALVQVAVFPSWSADGKYIYYSTLMKGVILGSEGVGVYRVRASDGHIDRLTPTPTFPLTGNWGFWGGPAPDGSPLVLREVGTSDVYGLDVDNL
jgi:Tol biopolymer transport system component/DNA-binding winged helix-turn-helix (wHTH) protein